MSMSDLNSPQKLQPGYHLKSKQGDGSRQAFSIFFVAVPLQCFQPKVACPLLMRIKHSDCVTSLSQWPVGSNEASIMGQSFWTAYKMASAKNS